MDERIKTALAKLEKGGWSLTVGGFALKALKLKPSAANRAIARSAMMETGLELRRVEYCGKWIDVWDFQK